MSEGVDSVNQPVLARWAVRLKTGWSGRIARGSPLQPRPATGQSQAGASPLGGERGSLLRCSPVSHAACHQSFRRSKLWERI